MKFEDIMGLDCLFILLIACLTLKSSYVLGYDPDPLQGFCVVIDEHKDEAVYVNGKFCKNPKLVTPNDFYLLGFDVPGNTSNPLGFNATIAAVDQLPGLNTLGISIFCGDYAPQGLTPLHTHPRGSEILIVIEGCVYVGFITSDPDNRLVAKELKRGDVFAIPPGLLHFVYNVGDTNATVIAATNSQNPDRLSTRAIPHIPVEVIARSYNVDEKVVQVLLEGWKNDVE